MPEVDGAGAWYYLRRWDRATHRAPAIPPLASQRQGEAPRFALQLRGEMRLQYSEDPAYDLQYLADGTLMPAAPRPQQQAAPLHPGKWEDVSVEVSVEVAP